MNDIWVLSMPWWAFVVRGVLVYLGLLALLRLLGKRALSDMSAFDIIVMILVGGSLRTAIVGNDTSMLGPAIGAVSILCTQKAMTWTSARWPRFNRWIEGWPAVVIRDGERDARALRKHDLSDTELDRALHAAGLSDESGVVVGRLEPNGRITLITRAHGQPGRC